MSRRSARKRGLPASSLESVDEQSSSKPKLPRKSPRLAVVWEWEGDEGKWNKYDASLSQQVTDALLKEDEDITLQVATGVKMKVRFNNMTQMNVRTGWQRNVRCVWTSGSGSSTGGGSGVWEWQDEHDKWNAYSPSIQRLLVACDLCGVEETEIEAAGRKYKIHLNNKKQVNVDTNVERKVRCNGKGEKETELDGNDDVATVTKNSSTVPSTRRTSSNARTRKEKKASGASVAEEEDDDPMEGMSSSSAAVETTDSHVIVTNKGKIPVDYECTQKIGKAHVYCEDGDHWDAMLNQTNLKNNNNKFYILQLLEDNSSSKYSVWFRWGRVGKTGQHMFTSCGSDLEQAKQLFKKKFFEKTVNDWEDRGSFVKHAGKYDLLAMDYEPKEEEEEETDQGTLGAGEDDVDGVKTEVKPPLVSKLDKRVQALIELISNIKEMEDTVVEMKFDVKKAPLGKLTTDQIKLGYQALKKIEDCIDKNHFGDKLVQACDAFYTRIPHSFGMQRPPLIRTREQVKEKITLLEALGDIQIAMKVLSGGKKEQDEHPVDRHYRGLKCQLSPIEKEEEVFGLIEKYVQQTHAATHRQYRMEVEEVFAMDKDGEEAIFKDVGNRQLLWHGSRLSNWVGILSQGLRIAPPEAPVTGYMFGKGIYFADMSSKSANYCFATKVKNEGLLLLCEVALGTTSDLLAADYNADELPRGKHSTRGLGKIAPDPKQNITLPDGCLVPLGTSMDTGVVNRLGYTLNYNEYVVYDTRQLKMKYLVRLKFHFK